MNLYRLDPPSWGDGLPNRLAVAIETAKVRAAAKRQPITVSRIDGRTLRVAAVREVQPDGTVKKSSDDAVRADPAYGRDDAPWCDL